MLLKVIFVFLFFVSFSFASAINRKDYMVEEMYSKAIAGSLIQQSYYYDYSEENKQTSLNIAPAVLTFTGPGPEEFINRYAGVQLNYSSFYKDSSVRYGVVFNLGQGKFTDLHDYEYKNLNGGFFLEKIKSKTERSFFIFLVTKRYTQNISDTDYIDEHYTQTMYYGRYINIKDKNISHNILFQRSFSVDLLSFVGIDKESTKKLTPSDILPRFGDIGFFYSPTFVFFLDKNVYFKLGAEFGLYLNGTKHFAEEREGMAENIPEFMERIHDYSQISADLFFVFHTGSLDFYLTKYKQGEFDNASIFVNYKLYSF